MKLKSMTVTELTAYIKQKLDYDVILSNLTVKGEVANFTATSKGHLYFSLMDEQAVLKCVMFASDTHKLTVMPKDGMTVLLKGRVSVYTQGGSYQLYVKELEEIGLGLIYEEFENNKRKLQEQGLFRDERKKPLPEYPKKVAVITSPTGAAVHDIIKVTKHRNPTVELLVYPTLVQGQEARSSIRQALLEVTKRKDIDAIILARGGGSFEDLSVFNDLDLAYAISDCPIPVVTGIGHDVDYTIADFVADQRAATPSQAAEVVIPSLLELKNNLMHQKRRLQNHLAVRVLMGKNRLEELGLRLKRNHPEAMIVHGILEVEQKRNRLNGIMSQRLLTERHRLEGAYSLLKAHNPLNILDKGYALVFDDQKRLVKEIKTLKKQRVLHIRLRDGEAVLEVNVDGEKSKNL